MQVKAVPKPQTTPKNVNLAVVPPQEVTQNVKANTSGELTEGQIRSSGTEEYNNRLEQPSESKAGVVSTEVNQAFNEELEKYDSFDDGPLLSGKMCALRLAFLPDSNASQSSHSSHLPLSGKLKIWELYR